MGGSERALSVRNAPKKEKINVFLLEGSLCFSSCHFVKPYHSKIASSPSIMGQMRFLRPGAEITLTNTGLEATDTSGMEGRVGENNE